MNGRDETVPGARTDDGAGGGDGPATPPDSGPSGAFGQAIRGHLGRRRLTVGSDDDGDLHIATGDGPKDEPVTTPDDNVRAEVAALLRGVLGAVDDGDLYADTPQARRLVRRIEGAVAALETDAS